MARDIIEIMREGISRAEFIAQQEEKAPRRKPAKTRMKPKRGTLFAKRNKSIAIREAALRRKQLIITYKKITTRETKKYVVAPYEISFRRLKAGRRKVLWGYDMKDKHIKSFVYTEIQKAAITDRSFRPKWPIKITSLTR